MFREDERQYVRHARVGRLATADGKGRPNVVPVCFALLEDAVVTPVDEKPKRVDPEELRRIRDLEENPRVALVVDHYAEDWSRLGWVQIRGTATCRQSTESGHDTAVSALREKYEQYDDHDLENRPLVWIAPSSVLSWGDLERRGP
ncbi:TIGR03668 family PPOX class F420-dependent oxidoreductase [Natrialbaceae archaeon A-gly3]